MGNAPSKSKVKLESGALSQSKICFGVSSCQGLRSEMEVSVKSGSSSLSSILSKCHWKISTSAQDAHIIQVDVRPTLSFIGVFDGHAGSLCSSSAYVHLQSFFFPTYILHTICFFLHFIILYPLEHIQVQVFYRTL